MRTFWEPWIGLPWMLGEDPRDSRGACCFRTAQAVREGLGLWWPADHMERWYDLARVGSWDALNADWSHHTVETKEQKPGALLRFNHPDGSFGLGVLVDERIMLAVPHHGRLLAAPHSVWRRRPRYELR